MNDVYPTKIRRYLYSHLRPYLLYFAPGGGGGGGGVGGFHYDDSHSFSSAPFICNIYIQRRLAPQIVIIFITLYLLEKVCFKACFFPSKSSVLQRMAGREFQRRLSPLKVP